MHQQTLPLYRKQSTQSTNQTNYVQNKVHSLQIKLIMYRNKYTVYKSNKLCTEQSTQSTNQINYTPSKVEEYKSKERIRNTNIKITTCNNASQL